MKLQKLDKLVKSRLKRDILDISFEYGLSHIGSCLTAVGIIGDIYNTKREKDKFILSQGHAGLALYVVLDLMYGVSARKMFESMGVHPDKLLDEGGYIHCSTGSLGHGLPIAIGMALADRTKDVWVLTSDGELAEGSMYESANVIRKYKIKNLHVFVNWNGWTGYDKTMVRKKDFKDVFHFIDTSKELKKFKSLQGLKGHYATLDYETYEQIENAI